MKEKIDTAAVKKSGSAIKRGEGRVHIEKIQPFLIIHQLDSNEPALVAERVAVTSGTYCLYSSERPSSKEHIQRVSKLFDDAAKQFERFLIIELAEENADEVDQEDSPELPQLFFSIACTGSDAVLQASEVIAVSLQKASLKYGESMVETTRVERLEWARHGITMLHDQADLIRITIPCVYYQPNSFRVFPELLESISAAVYDAVLRGIFEFASQTQFDTPPHYRAYGRRVLVKAAGQIDQDIDVICRSFDFLLSITPINTEQCWLKFEDSGYSTSPAFRYRPLGISTSELKRKLHSINVDIIEDPVLIRIFREKQQELDHQLTMLQLRENSKFRQASTLVYDLVTETERRQAEAALDRINRDQTPADECDTVLHDCHSVKFMAEKMIARYQSNFPDFQPKVIIRDDVPAGLLVSADTLIVSRHTSVPEHRLDALLNHEIGVHLVTYFAGHSQPLKIFRSGLAGYEGIQEGLGVFAEYAVGGLTANRLKLLAARVIACEMMLSGSEFIETFNILVKEYNFGPRAAFNIAMRVHRSGGISKDAIYLRGLLSVLEILKNKGQLDVFWIGKIGPQHISDIEELINRGLIGSATVKPEFLANEYSAQRVKMAGAGLELSDLYAP